MVNNPQNKETIFIIQKMDCPTEEKLIRNKLQTMPGISGLRFNLMQRELTVLHNMEDTKPIETAIIALGMNPKQQGAGCDSCSEHGNVGVSAITKILISISGTAASRSWHGSKGGKSFCIMGFVI